MTRVLKCTALNYSERRQFGRVHHLETLHPSIGKQEIMNEVVLAVLKVLTSMSTICVYLSPSVNMVRCHKNQSMGATQFIPFVCMFGNSHLW